MWSAAWRLSQGYRLRPWRSPYLLWRIETYSGLHADRITASDFWRFVWRERRQLTHFLDWADRMHAARKHPANLLSPDFPGAAPPSG